MLGIIKAEQPGLLGKADMLAALLPAVLTLSRHAGAAILAIYQRGDVAVSHKADASPLTEADLAAHQLLVHGLQQLTPHWPVLSEESAQVPWGERQGWSHYWLVDPLDGTKEFLQRNGEFTVNIALIVHGVPVLGVVYVPVLHTCYYGVQGLGAWKEAGAQVTRLHTSALANADTLRVVASRSHRGEELDAWVVQAAQRYAAIELVSMGSSLKICLVAEGKADIYPRLALTSEWDTAAAQAVLEAAGGTLFDQHGALYRYNRKENLLNPFFYAVGDAEQGRKLALVCQA